MTSIPPAKSLSPSDPPPSRWRRKLGAFAPTASKPAIRLAFVRFAALILTQKPVPVYSFARPAFRPDTAEPSRPPGEGYLEARASMNPSGIHRPRRDSARVRSTHRIPVPEFLAQIARYIPRNRPARIA